MHRRRPGRHRRGGDGLIADLPYVDTHQVALAAPPDAVWQALPVALTAAYDGRRSRVIGWILRCDDEGDATFDGSTGETLAGFHVTRSDPPRSLVLEGRHRFSRYRLAFEIIPDGTGSRVRAVTHAEFPGLRGRLYRALVIGTGGHRMVTRGLLRSIAREAERTPSMPSTVKEVR